MALETSHGIAEAEWYRILIMNTAINISLAYPQEGPMGSASFQSLLFTVFHKTMYIYVPTSSKNAQKPTYVRQSTGYGDKYFAEKIRRTFQLFKKAERINPMIN